MLVTGTTGAIIGSIAWYEKRAGARALTDAAMTQVAKLTAEHAERFFRDAEPAVALGSDSDTLFPNLRRRFGLGLEREDVRPDLQIVMPGLDKTLESGPRLKPIDAAVVVGLCVYMRF